MLHYDGLSPIMRLIWFAAVKCESRAVVREEDKKHSCKIRGDGIKERVSKKVMGVNCNSPLL